MRQFFLIFPLSFIFSTWAISADYEYHGDNIGEQFLGAKVNTTVTLKLPAKAIYERYVYKKTGESVLQIYRVCNGKNKGKCGFWEIKKTKKKVASGATSYDKTKKALIIKKFKKTDFGDYKGGNTVITVYDMKSVSG